MDIFGVLDPDPHENLCRSETLTKSLNLRVASLHFYLNTPDFFNLDSNEAKRSQKPISDIAIVGHMSAKSPKFFI